MKIGIALSGGGAQGDFEVGALRFLYDQGLRPEIVTGVSVGSIHAAAIAMGEGGLEILEKTWRELQNSDQMFVHQQWVNGLPPKVRSLIDGIAGKPSTGDELVSGRTISAFALGILMPFNIGSLISFGFDVAALVDAFKSLSQASGLMTYEPIMMRVRQILLDNWLTLDPASRRAVAAARHADGRAEVFVRGLDRMLWRAVQPAPGAPFGAPIPFDKEVNGRPVTLVHADGKLEVFVRGPDGAIWRRKQTLPGGGPSFDAWDAWQQLGSPGWKFASNPAAGRDDSGLVVVVARGTDNTLWQCRFANGAWGDWMALGGSALSADPVMIVDRSGHLQVLVRGGGGSVYQQQVGTGAWIDHGAPPGGGVTSNLAVTINKLGGLELFARGQDGALWYRRGLGGAGLQPWESLGGDLAGDPAVGRNEDGRVEVYARFTDGQLHHRWHIPPGIGWGSWGVLDGAWAGDPVLPHDDGVTAEGRSAQCLTVLIPDTGGALRSITQASPNGGWPAAVTIGGTVWPGIRLRLGMVAMNQGRTRYTDESGRFLDAVGAPYEPATPGLGEPGRIADQILASCSIPMFFSPVALGPDLYLDAGIREPLPIQAALDAGAEHVYGVCTQAPFEPTAPPQQQPSIITVAGRTIAIMANEMLEKNTTPEPIGWDKRITMIRPTFDVNGSFQIEPGHIRIAMDYGFLRANDAIGPYRLPPRTGGVGIGLTIAPAGPTAAQYLSSSTDELIGLRLGIHWLEEIANGGQMVVPSFPAYYPDEAKLNPIPGVGGATIVPFLVDVMQRVRALKIRLQALAKSRVSKLGGQLPPGHDVWWTNWEQHVNFAMPATPWSEWFLGNVSVLPAATPPANV